MQAVGREFRINLVLRVVLLTARTGLLIWFLYIVLSHVLDQPLSTDDKTRSATEQSGNHKND